MFLLVVCVGLTSKIIENLPFNQRILYIVFFIFSSTRRPVFAKAVSLAS